MSEISKIHTSIDFNQEGIQTSTLSVPQPSNQSAWGSIQVPIVSIKNGHGPKVLMTAGIHGDEFEGPIALRKFIQKIEASDIQGQVIVMPGVNTPGLKASTRLCPIDGKDMNRNFPGNPRGTYSDAICHYMAKILLPLVDVVIDFHSGGHSLEFTPCSIIHNLEDKQQFKQTHMLQKAFNAPMSMTLTEIDTFGLWDFLVESQNKLFLSTELGGCGKISPTCLKVAEQGIESALSYLDMLKTEQTFETNTNFYEIPNHDFYIIADKEGLFEPFVELKQWVQEGEVLGQIHTMDSLMTKPSPLVAKASGVMIGQRPLARTHPGDCLMVLAQPSKLA